MIIHYDYYKNIPRNTLVIDYSLNSKYLYLVSKEHSCYIKSDEGSQKFYYMSFEFMITHRKYYYIDLTPHTYFYRCLGAPNLLVVREFNYKVDTIRWAMNASIISFTAEGRPFEAMDENNLKMDSSLKFKNLYNVLVNKQGIPC